MSYRDILVHTDNSAASVMRVKAAVEIAGRSATRLTGAFLESDFLRQFMAAESISALSPGAITQVLDGHRTAVAEAMAQARATFMAAVGDAGVESDWLTLNGDQSMALIAAVHRADLTLFPKSAQVCLGEHTIGAASLALAAGGPVLVLPQDGYAPPVGKRVLIAWNGSREAARALRDAWPLIAAADERHVLIVAPTGDEVADQQLQRLFDRRGCKANFIFDAGRDETAAKALDRQVVELDADLVVMGLYGHSRLQEVVLGGVSRHMLSELRVPLLVSH